MKRLLLSLWASAAAAQLLPDATLRAILEQISPENATEHTRALSSWPRYPASHGFFEAAGYVAAQARAAGLENLHVERFPGKAPTWDAVEAELTLLEPEQRALANLRDTAVLLARFSGEGDVTGELIDVGAGTRAADYDGKDVKGKILLARGMPAAVWRAMGDRGAAAVLSSAAGEFFGRRTSPDAVLWGQASREAVSMMISPRQGDELRRLLEAGKRVKVRMRARVKRSEPGMLGLLTGELYGELRNQDVVVVAHLDHQKPGANDNASGGAAILEALATLQRLRAAGKLPPLRRTVRFWWSTEIVSEREYFAKYPEQARKMILAVNLDQAGGDRNAENNLVAILGPDWLPSFADDLIYNLAEYVKETYAPAEHEPSPLVVAPNGGRQSLRTVYWPYAPLSDHIAFADKRVGVPCISVGVPSLHVIHTDQDTPDRIDPTWMKRSILLALAPALFAAYAGPEEARALAAYVFRRAAVRLAEAGDPHAQLTLEEKRLDSVRVFDAALDTEPYQAKLRRLAASLSGNNR